MNYTAQRSGSVGNLQLLCRQHVSVSGRRPQDNLYLLNGVEYTGASLINVTPGGTSGQLLGVDAVREFNVSSDTYSAAYRQASGRADHHRNGQRYQPAPRRGLRISPQQRASMRAITSTSSNSRIPAQQLRRLRSAAPSAAIRSSSLATTKAIDRISGISNVAFVPDTKRAKVCFPSGNPAAHSSNVGVAPGVVTCSSFGPRQTVRSSPTPKANPPASRERSAVPSKHIREDFGTARSDYNLSPRRTSSSAVYTMDDSIAHTPTAKPLLAHRRIAARTGRQHPGAAHLLLAPAQHGPLRLLPRHLLFPRQHSPFDPGTSRLPRGQARRRYRHRRFHRLQWRIADHRRGRQRRQQQCRRAQPLHLRRSCLLFAPPQIEVGGWLQRSRVNDNLAQNQDGQASFATLRPSCRAPSRPSPSYPIPRRSTGGAVWALAYLEDIWKATPRSKFAPGSASKPAMAGTKPTAALANYRFTNGIINTNPTTGTSALVEQSREDSLPQPRVGLAWEPFGNGTTSSAPPSDFIKLFSITSTIAWTRPRRPTRRSPTPAPRSADSHQRAPGHLSLQRSDPTSPLPALSLGRLSIEQQLAPKDLAHGRLRRLSRLSPDPLRRSKTNQPPSSARTQAAPRSTRRRHHLLPDDCKGEPARQPTPRLGSPAVKQLQRPRSRSCAATYANGLQVPRQLHRSQEPRQRLRLEHKRLGQHTRIRLLSGKSFTGLGPAATDIRHIAAFNGYLRATLRPRPPSPGHRVAVGQPRGYLRLELSRHLQPPIRISLHPTTRL